jgi:hypothetical protein
MDPNTTLQEMRELTKRNNDCDLSAFEVDRLADLVDSIDQWLSRGGFPPKDWKHRNPEDAIHIPLYKYVGCVDPTPTGKFRGQVHSVDPNKPGVHESWKNATRFEFEAYNDAHAFALLNAFFQPTDPRPLRSLSSLTRCRQKG